MLFRRYFRLVLLVVAVLGAMMVAVRSLKSVPETAETVNAVPQEGLPRVAAPGLFTKVSELFLGSWDDGDTDFPLSDSFLTHEGYTAHELRTFTDPHGHILDKPKDYEFAEKSMCGQIEYKGYVHVRPQMMLEAEFSMVQQALAKNSFYAKVVSEGKAKFKPVLPENMQWFRFGGSSVWLPHHKVHYMVSRVLFLPLGIANKAFASFLYVQLFDQGWNELPPETTLEVPYQKHKLHGVVNSDGLTSEVVLHTTVNTRKVKYPGFLPIGFEYLLDVKNKKYYYGPEDPRIIARKSTLGFREPLVVFNMKSILLQKRVMHQYLPFLHELKILRKRLEPFAYIEKNWTPFMSKLANRNSDGDTRLNFVYSLDPLEVLTCEIDTAVCDFLQRPAKEDYDYVGPLRGGTQLVPLPLDSLPSHVRDKFALPQSRLIYVGWARTHLNKCGCGESMYRPNMIILVEDYDAQNDKHYYKVADVLAYVDFGAAVPPWTAPALNEEGQLVQNSQPKQCAGRNVLIPNLIAYWNVELVILDKKEYGRKEYHRIPTEDELADRKGSKVHKGDTSHAVVDYDMVFNDYMGVTLSAADSDVSVVHVKGLLNYIVRMPSLYDENTVVKEEGTFHRNGFDFNLKCATTASKEYCVKYGNMYGEGEEENKDEK